MITEKIRKDVEQIFKQVVALKCDSDLVETYTRGHFKQGVEHRNKKWQSANNCS